MRRLRRLMRRLKKPHCAMAWAFSPRLRRTKPLRPRQEAVDLLSGALSVGGKAADAVDGEGARRPRNDVEPSFLNSGRPALSDLRYIIARRNCGSQREIRRLPSSASKFSASARTVGPPKRADNFEIRARTEIGVVASGPRTRKPPASQKAATDCIRTRATRLRS